MPTLLFLCTGNYYRSRFAEHLFNALARPRGLPWSADSRGLALELGSRNVGPIAASTILGLRARGIALAEPIRPPTQVGEADVAAAQRIIALYEREHRPMLAERYPAWAGRVEYWQVPDVGELPPLEALSLIEREVAGLLDELGARHAGERSAT